ncbi:hypothetical protein O6H91_15G013300 [Diphasiastrum complanatum]|uniref:Uncharacterized protein n=2 Tax=Diphasiastrum complanatum TaxID=34168 RepID=A0ACC2BFV7_DIPCM|nr:hypothetical protein O6H91_15G013100 [Diphasiastrum complanatum]KAJ7528674.1 hypothetical protein O6H91_15G013300 [Diphasiastrum complanatum]
MKSTDSSSHSESVQDMQQQQQQRGMASSNGGSRHGAHEDYNNNEYHDQEAVDSVDEEDALPSGSVSYHTPSPRRGSKSSSLMSLAFPLSRVKRLIKSEGEIQWVGMEAAFLIAKAAELFLEKFVEDSFDQMTDNNRMYLSYGDLSSHVMSTERLEFLADFVPEKVAASIALSTKIETDN